MRISRELLIGILGLLVTVLGVVIAIQQFSLQQLQFLSQQPRLEYSFGLVLSETDEEVVFEASEQLVEDFYERVYEFRQTSPDTTYLEAVNAILPMIATIPAQPVTMVARIRNSGEGTATKVHAVIDMDRPITSIDVESLEPYDVIRGGLGGNQSTIEVDRIVPGDIVTITVVSDIVESETQLDQVILYKEERIVDYFYTIESGPPFVKSIFLPSIPSIPNLRYVVAQGPIINMKVTSEQGPASALATPTSNDPTLDVPVFEFP